MNNGHQMTLNLTVGTIGKIGLENHFRLLLRFNILFSVLTQKRETHHPEAEEEEKGQTAEVSDIIAIHDYIVCEF
jgi:hypothetical protein